MIKYSLTYILLFLVMIFQGILLAQENVKFVEGEVTYLSSKNVYVKFSETTGIEVGDTLFFKKDGVLLPVILAEHLSSTSCAGSKIKDLDLSIGYKLYAKILVVEKLEEVEPTQNMDIVSEIPKDKKEESKKSKPLDKAGNIYGRFGVSSYANLSNVSSADFLRWRYTFSAVSDNFNSSDFSFNSYISFNYRSTDWSYIKNNISDALKIYSLSVKYDFNEDLNLVVGRDINRNITNIGAVDGFQLSQKLNNFNVGVIAGSRPDYTNYGFDYKMFEFGGYVSHSNNFGDGIMQNSIAVLQQTNDFKTDRRFLYFQHSSNIIQPINLFVSSEVDLYKKELGISSSTFSLTGLYLSLRYRPSRIINFNASFDSRKNVIYYETFQNYADSLYENATRQGVRFGVNVRPLNNLSLSGSYGYRFQANDLRTTTNIAGNLTYSNVPFLTGSLGVSWNNLKTSYLDGNIYGIRYSRDLFSDVIYSTLSLRRVNYNFINGTPALDQQIVGLDFSCKIMKQLSLSISYEGTFEKVSNYSRFFFNLTKRF